MGIGAHIPFGNWLIPHRDEHAHSPPAVNEPDYYYSEQGRKMIPPTRRPSRTNCALASNWSTTSAIR